MTLLLVDASNILMRCAFGGDVPADQSTPKAVAMIGRAIAHSDASHLVIALDSPGTPTWRKLECATYKADKIRDIAPWLAAGVEAFRLCGWHCESHPGFEADDVIATIGLRAVAHTQVSVLSGDSDLLPLTAAEIVVVKPLVGGEFQPFIARDVCEKYQIPAAHLLFDHKAMVGEEGIPGVPLIGMKRAADLLQKFGGLEAIIHAGSGGYDKYSALVAEHADVARRALRLVSLRPDVPVTPIAPRRCAVKAA